MSMEINGNTVALIALALVTLADSLVNRISIAWQNRQLRRQNAQLSLIEKTTKKAVKNTDGALTSSFKSTEIALRTGYIALRTLAKVTKSKDDEDAANVAMRLLQDQEEIIKHREEMAKASNPEKEDTEYAPTSD